MAEEGEDDTLTLCQKGLPRAVLKPKESFPQRYIASFNECMTGSLAEWTIDGMYYAGKASGDEEGISGGILIFGFQLHALGQAGCSDSEPTKVQGCTYTPRKGWKEGAVKKPIYVARMVTRLIDQHKCGQLWRKGDGLVAEMLSHMAARIDSVHARQDGLAIVQEQQGATLEQHQQKLEAMQAELRAVASKAELSASKAERSAGEAKESADLTRVQQTACSEFANSAAKFRNQASDHHYQAQLEAYRSKESSEAASSAASKATGAASKAAGAASKATDAVSAVVGLRRRYLSTSTSHRPAPLVDSCPLPRCARAFPTRLPRQPPATPATAI